MLKAQIQFSKILDPNNLDQMYNDSGKHVHNMKSWSNLEYDHDIYRFFAGKHLGIRQYAQK